MDWIGKGITTIAAFFASDAFIFALLWLIVPYLVAWGALLRSHRPWSSPGWVLSPLIVALAALGGAGVEAHRDCQANGRRLP
ncbi:MAG TPA: hypothetical protein VFF19_29150 [Reyranella sp.]|nr:hypothetical protein [Reyranella sp.]